MSKLLLCSMSEIAWGKVESNNLKVTLCPGGDC